MNFPHGTNSTTVGKKRRPAWLEDLASLGVIIAALAFVAAIFFGLCFSNVHCEAAKDGHHYHFFGRCL